MSTNRVPPRSKAALPRSKAGREAGLRRVGLITRWVAASGAAATGLFAGLAAHGAATTTTTASRTTTKATTATASTDDNATSDDGSAATTATTTPSTSSASVQSSSANVTPVVVSGAS